MADDCRLTKTLGGEWEMYCAPESSLFKETKPKVDDGWSFGSWLLCKMASSSYTYGCEYKKFSEKYDCVCMGSPTRFKAR